MTDIKGYNFTELKIETPNNLIEKIYAFINDYNDYLNSEEKKDSYYEIHIKNCLKDFKRELEEYKKEKTKKILNLKVNEVDIQNEEIEKALEDINKYIF